MTDKSFTNWHSLSDDALMRHIGLFIRHKRMQGNLTQDELAVSSGISRSTLSLLERGETVTLPTLLQVLRVLDQLHVMNFFEIVETISPLTLAKLQKQKRQRASRRIDKTSDKPQTDW